MYLTLGPLPDEVGDVVVVVDVEEYAALSEVDLPFSEDRLIMGDNRKGLPIPDEPEPEGFLILVLQPFNVQAPEFNYSVDCVVLELNEKLLRENELGLVLLQRALSIGVPK